MRARLSDGDIDRLRAALAPPVRPKEPDCWLESKEFRRLAVHTRDNQTFEGMLVLTADDGLVLRSARLRSKSQDVPLGGEVFIPREQVSFVQTVRT